MVRVPDVDGGRPAPRDVLAIIVDVSCFGLYQLDTNEGLLEWLYAGNEFTTADNNFSDAHDVPSSSLSLWSACDNVWKYQGFVSCNCKRHCSDKKWKCLSKNTKCNSKCHSNSCCKGK